MNMKTLKIMTWKIQQNKKWIQPDKVEFNSEIQGCFNIRKSVSALYYINK